MSTDRIEKHVFLAAPMSRVWRAISDPQEFGSWFGMKIDGSFTPGAKLTGFIVGTKVDEEVAKAQKQHEGLPFHILIEQVQPNRLFSYRWHPFAIDRNKDYSQEPTTLVEFKLEETAGGVNLTIVESGFDQIPLERRAKAFEANSGGWGKQIELIQKYLAAHAQHA